MSLMTHCTPTTLITHGFSLSGGELLRTACLYGRDQLTGRGFNLVAVVPLEKKRTILNAVPFYRTDVVLRRVETDCCDGGLVCRCNLVRAYDEIISFCEKCLRLLRARRGTA